ncbi:MAG: hypothetical protein RLZZ427_950 [Pseudomonadota bacterium]
MVKLYGPGKAPGSESWALPETTAARPDGRAITYNVVSPEYSVHLPAAAQATGTAVIILPGGGLRQLGDDAELVRRFNAAGVAVFRLKYRVLQLPPPAPAPSPAAPASGQSPQPEFPALAIHHANANPAPDDPALTRVLDLAVEDARTALRLIRGQAAQYGIDPNRIGMLGTSAGGGVAIGALLRRGNEPGPAFLVSVYGPSLIDVAVPTDAPPLFIAVEAGHGPVTDGLFALDALWRQAGRHSELHVFDVPAFQMKPDMWFTRMQGWLAERGFGKPATPGKQP